MVLVNLSNDIESFQLKNFCKSLNSQKHFRFWIDFIDFSAGDIRFYEMHIL